MDKENRSSCIDAVNDRSSFIDNVCLTGDHDVVASLSVEADVAAYVRQQVSLSMEQVREDFRQSLEHMRSSIRTEMEREASLEINEAAKKEIEEAVAPFLSYLKEFNETVKSRRTELLWTEESRELVRHEVKAEVGEICGKLQDCIDLLDNPGACARLIGNCSGMQEGEISSIVQNQVEQAMVSFASCWRSEFLELRASIEPTFFTVDGHKNGASRTCEARVDAQLAAVTQDFVRSEVANAVARIAGQLGRVATEMTSIMNSVCNCITQEDAVDLIKQEIAVATGSFITQEDAISLMQQEITFATGNCITHEDAAAHMQQEITVALGKEREDLLQIVAGKRAEELAQTMAQHEVQRAFSNIDISALAREVSGQVKEEARQEVMVATRNIKKPNQQLSHTSRVQLVQGQSEYAVSGGSHASVLHRDLSVGRKGQSNSTASATVFNQGRLRSVSPLPTFVSNGQPHPGGIQMPSVIAVPIAS
jgi:hypothetical protein